ncbi:hypothetical protein QQ020_23025 [Fulvivirgaceae bacterium BMA12]|uniref:Uncharacterized protein n=1 Tax=Agaribacillus aureus TaxID=3051825 RepID=A0ABT8LB48_9BACT|nr:hypothetical protein [Fulvivirgaceae bacterium BMA12]
MPTSYKKVDVKRLLECLCSKTGESLDYYGLGQISEIVSGSISHKYLYDNLYRKTQTGSGDDEIRLAPNKVDELTRFLGYQNFSSFLTSIKMPLDPVLKSLEGSYYSYVRKSDNIGTLLCSPVCIEEIENQVILKLRGPNWEYVGKLKLVDGCLFCTMRSEESKKSFHHVYKVGKGGFPEVLMGLFTGVSTANNPIAGRCVLIKQAEQFDKLQNQKMSIAEMDGSQNQEYKKLATYFKTFEDNNLQINKPVGFDIDDLIP